MLRRPYQVWTVFCLALMLVLGAMVWLSINAMEVDQARSDLLVETEAARLTAKEQDLVRATVWRMDSILTPLVGPETTRPYAYFQPFIPQPSALKGEPGTGQVPSPLLENPSEYVVVHFQVDESGQWSSPQSPTGDFCEMAMACGVSMDRMNASGDQLVKLGDRVSFNTLADCLPDDPLREYLADGRLLSMGDWLDPWVAQSIPDINTADFSNSQMNRLRGYRPPDLTQNGIIERNNDSQTEGQTPVQQLEIGNGEQQGRQSDETSQQGDPPPQFAQQSEGRQQRASESQTQELDRGGVDWIQRHQAYQTYTDSALSQQSIVANNVFGSPGLIEESIARWIWLEGDLLLARRVDVSGHQLIQGCWIDWPTLKTQLLEDVSGIMDGIDLIPIDESTVVDPAKTLATVPVQLVILDERRALGVERDSLATSQNSTTSPIRVTLILAWASCLAASLAVGLLLQGVIRLSERRAAFVSAVTHELRTPLTTFRMYAEMLAEDMVSDEQKRREYLGTLRVESDRLTHLVGNVLSYSRLERGRPGRRREQLRIHELVERLESRLQARANESGMKLIIDLAKGVEDESVATDPAAVEQIVFNLVENACKYGQSKSNELRMSIETSESHWTLTVSDQGPGISPADRKRLFQPFSKSVERAAETAPGVGLGLALCRRLAHALGGRLTLAPPSDEPGARFQLRLPRN